MQAACELPELLERLGELEARRREDLRRLADVVGELRLRESERERERREALLGAVVEVSLEATAGGVGRGHDPAARGPHLLFLALALGDVGAGDQYARDAPLVEDRRRRPGDRPLAAAAREPARLSLGLWNAVRRSCDRHPGRELVLGSDEVEERRPLDAFLCPVEGVQERAVGAPSHDDGVVVGDDDEARDRVGDRGGEVPLPLEIDLAPLALGDVDPSGDDAHDSPVLVDERCGAPGDDVLLALRVRERVLVLARWEVGGDVVEHLPHLLALVGVEEDVPEVRTLDQVPVVEPARDLERAVEVAESALRVDDGEQARRRVDDGLEEPVLRADLCLQPLLLESESCCRGDGFDELALVGQAPVVDQRGDALPALLDERRGVRALGDRLRQSSSLVVDPRLPLVRPVRELRATGRRARRRAASRSGEPLPIAIDEVGDAGAREPLRRIPARNAIGISAAEQSATYSSTIAARVAERRDDAAR